MALPRGNKRSPQLRSKFCERADEPHDRHHPQQHRRRDAPDVHVVVGEKDIEGLEKEIRRGVTQCVPDVFPSFETLDWELGLMLP